MHFHDDEYITKGRHRTGAWKDMGRCISKMDGYIGACGKKTRKNGTGGILEFARLGEIFEGTWVNNQIRTDTTVTTLNGTGRWLDCLEDYECMRPTLQSRVHSISGNLDEHIQSLVELPHVKIQLPLTQIARMVKGVGYTTPKPQRGAKRTKAKA